MAFPFPSANSASSPRLTKPLPRRARRRAGRAHCVQAAGCSHGEAHVKLYVKLRTAQCARQALPHPSARRRSRGRRQPAERAGDHCSRFLPVLRPSLTSSPRLAGFGVSVGKRSLSAVACHHAAVDAAHGFCTCRSKRHESRRVNLTEVGTAHGLFAGFEVVRGRFSNERTADSPPGPSRQPLNGRNPLISQARNRAAGRPAGPPRGWA